ncbi:MAG: hypothetical protein CSA33_05075 [Desulfobulbus propionicus]|nr:MAG: hypothetical protein CSA33_05075 [Desulfobulbus propionicus]
MNKQSVVNFDLLRVVACFLVVLLHTSGYKFYIFDEYWWASNFYDSLSRCSVPIFFMISGALLLTKEENIFLFYKKRVQRLLPPIIAWSIIYMLWNYYHGVSYGNLWGWIKTLLKGPVFFHLWYLYSIFGLYLFTPFLRKIYINSSIKEKVIFLFIWFFVSSLPSLSHLFDIKANIVSVYNLKYFSDYIGYFFSGAFLYEYRRNVTKYNIINILGYMISVFCIMFFTYIFSKKNGSPTEIFYVYTSIFVIMSSLFFYNICYKAGYIINNLFAKIIRYLSQLTLGIYCIHILVMDRLYVYFSINVNMGNVWWSIPLTAVISFCFSAIIILIIKKIKIIRVIV